MYDERDRKSVRTRRKLADLVARDPRQRDNGPVKRFADEYYFVAASYACYRHI
jgi:hypothetical protein